MRQPVTLSICTVSVERNIQTLLENKTHHLTEFSDCAEMLRYSQMRFSDIPEHYFKRMPDPVSTDYEFVYQLKVHLVLANARQGMMK